MRRKVAQCCGIAAVISATLIFHCAFAQAENRVALVIGNSKYQSIQQLATPADDAKAFANFLSTVNFQVLVNVDVAQTDLRRAIHEFSAAIAAKGSDTVALLYYAGYAVQLDGEDFLVPVDARIEREGDVSVEALKLTDILNAISAVPSKSRIFIIDGAHGNPYVQFNSISGHGLAVVDAPPASVVAFSTAPGTDGANRPFTATLMQALKSPGLSVIDALGLVRVATFEASNGVQCPWETSNLTAGFSMFPGPAPIAPPDNHTKPANFWIKEIRSRPELDAFRFIISQNSADGYAELIRAYPQATYIPLIRSLVDREQEMLAWHNATKLNSFSSYDAFITRYPNSDLAPSARRLLERVRASSTSTSTTAPPTVVPTPTAPAVSEEKTPPKDNTSNKKASSKDSDEARPRRRVQARSGSRDIESSPRPQPEPGPPMGIGLGIGGISIDIGR